MADDEDNTAEAPAGPVAEEGSPDPGGNQTMQVDAFVEELESGTAVPNDALAQILADSRQSEPQVSVPPPLPPKKVGPATIVVGVLIVVLAAGGGIFFGMNFLEPEPVVQDTPDPVVLEEDVPDEEATFVPIQLDEVVVPHPDDELLDEAPPNEDEPPEDELP